MSFQIVRKRVGLRVRVSVIGVNFHGAILSLTVAILKLGVWTGITYLVFLVREYRESALFS